MWVFESPGWLALVPLLVLWWLMRGRSRGLSFSSLDAGARVRLGKRIFADLPKKFIQLAACLSIVMLANPLGDVERTYKTTRAYRIAIALDKSASMMGEYEKIARKATEDFISRREGDLMAFLPFAETAFFSEGAAFTSDRQYLSDATRAYRANGGGTAIGDGILGGVWYIFRDLEVMYRKDGKVPRLVRFAELHHVLGKGGPEEIEKLTDRLRLLFGVIEGSFIVLITDGESNSGVPPDTAINFAKAFGIPIYVIGIGGQEGSKPSFYETLMGAGGGYFHASSPQLIENMYKEIEKLQPTLTTSAVIVEQKTARPLLGFVAASLLFFAAVARFAFLVIE